MPALTATTDTNALMQAASCMKCIPRGMQLEVLIYLLNDSRDTPLTVQQLLDGAVCMKCIPTGMQLEVVASLINDLYNA